MEKDLREAYAALKLLRADLLQTRRDKRALEAAVALLPPAPSHSSSHRDSDSDGADAARMQDRLLMRQEDLQTQLQQLARSRDAELAALRRELAHARAQTDEPRRLAGSSDGETEDTERPELASDDGRGPSKPERSNQTEAQDADAAVQDQLALLAKLHSLRATVEQQTQALATQRAQHAHETHDWAARLEDARQELAQARAAAADAQHERQAAEEKLAFLQTQLSMLAGDKRALSGQVAALESDKQELTARLEEVELDRLRGHLELQVARADAARLQSELKSAGEQGELQTRDAEREMATHAQTSRRLEQQLAAKQDEMQTLRDEQQRREQELVTRLQQEKASRDAEAQRRLQDEQQRRQEAARQAQADVDALRTDAAQRVAQMEQMDKTLRALAMDKRALQQEVREARQTAKLTKDEVLKCQAALSRERVAVDHKLQAAVAASARSERRAELLETQLLAAEDHRSPLEDACVRVDVLQTLATFRDVEVDVHTSDPTVMWTLLRRGVRELADVLPRLETLWRTLRDALALCGEHADALAVLCERRSSQQDAEDSVVDNAMDLLRLVVTLRRHVEQPGAACPTLQSVRSVHQRLVDALALWYECDAGPESSETSAGQAAPPPTFAIASRETALILQNWTRDRSAQVAAKRWLARMEAYPYVPVTATRTPTTVRKELQEPLPREGSTLELEHMTPEVKAAFCLLVVPILKQNALLHVRVFTRRVPVDASVGRGAQGGPQTQEEDEKLWAMRIHVQAVDTGGRPSRRRPPPRIATSSSGEALEAPSGLAPTSPASSVSSSTSSTASSRLQLLQERLHHLHTS